MWNESEGKVYPRRGHECPEGAYRHSITPSLNSALDGGGWLTPSPGHFTPGKDPVPIVQEAGWTPGPVWAVAESLNPTGIRSPGRKPRSE